MKVLLIFAAVLGVALAADLDFENRGYVHKTYYKIEAKGDGHKDPYGGRENKNYGYRPEIHGYDRHTDYGYKQSYHGHYSGKCGADGIYYSDARSFALCSNGLGYIQACAPGTGNSGYGKYQYGHNYHSQDFCDVNLVDYGYAGAHNAYEAHGAPHGSYAGYGRGDYGYKTHGYHGYGHGNDLLDGYGYKY